MREKDWLIIYTVILITFVLGFCLGNLRTDVKAELSIEYVSIFMIQERNVPPLLEQQSDKDDEELGIKYNYEIYEVTAYSG
ncbi:hypothetical protein [Chengkuizengella axinellae]|uniref:DUF3139 domain-containing protein n=1 Tax=Chengkuizengella axinellae TaxID=3064388 RepID=A0ABT9IV52_9BACL|nr:hypothetical protein [Chengkuizengella sp. 2205SS18-9]MDP5273202.1 hypothetical protein [Chengkuizengella sp. 2205SS18-9]